MADVKFSLFYNSDERKIKLWSECWCQFYLFCLHRVTNIRIFLNLSGTVLKWKLKRNIYIYSYLWIIHVRDYNQCLTLLKQRYSSWVRSVSDIWSFIARFQLSCNLIQTIQIKNRKWSLNFSKILRLDTSWCQSIDPFAIVKFFYHKVMIEIFQVTQNVIAMRNGKIRSNLTIKIEIIPIWATIVPNNSLYDVLHLLSD